MKAVRLHLSDSAIGAKTWNAGVDASWGSDCIPLMTMHKSKGLECDAILFMGPDDQSWWSHSLTNPDGLATFFVAFSPVKNGSIFTFFEEQRGCQKGVADLYALLSSAGVREEDFRRPD